MAGKVATIISLEKDLPHSERKIVKALRNCRHTSDVNVQPIDGTFAYLILNNKKKATAESDLFMILNSYKGFGGIEYDEDVLSDDAPKPRMAGINNDAVRFIPSPVSPIYLNDPEWCLKHGVALP